MTIKSRHVRRVKIVTACALPNNICFCRSAFTFYQLELNCGCFDLPTIFFTSDIEMDATIRAHSPTIEPSTAKRGHWQNLKRLLRSPFNCVKRCFRGCRSDTVTDTANTAHVSDSATPVIPSKGIFEHNKITTVSTDARHVKDSQVVAAINLSEPDQTATLTKAEPADTVSVRFVASPTLECIQKFIPSPRPLYGVRKEPIVLPTREVCNPPPCEEQCQPRRVITSPWPRSPKTPSPHVNNSAPQLFLPHFQVSPSSENTLIGLPDVLAQYSERKGVTTSKYSVVEGSDVVEVADYSLTTGWDNPENLVSCEAGEVLVPKEMTIYADSYSAKSYKVIGALGAGAFGAVVLAMDDLGREVALKALPSIEKKGRRAKERMSLEIAAQSAVRHCSSVQLFATFSEGPRFFMVLEYACNGSLSYRIARSDGIGLDPSFAARVTLQVASALQVLHSQGYVHRDLKPGNIVLGNNEDAKVCDYGICGKVGTNGPCITYCGTKAYCAPEVNGNQPYDEAVDLWSLGVVIFEMLTGSLPFENVHPTKNGNIVDVPDGSVVSEQALDLIRRLLCIDPKHRLPLSEVCAHPWVVQNADRVG